MSTQITETETRDPPTGPYVYVRGSLLKNLASLCSSEDDYQPGQDILSIRCSDLFDRPCLQVSNGHVALRVLFDGPSGFPAPQVFISQDACKSIKANDRVTLYQDTLEVVRNPRGCEPRRVYLPYVERVTSKLHEVIDGFFKEPPRMETQTIPVVGVGLANGMGKLLVVMHALGAQGCVMYFSGEGKPQRIIVDRTEIDFPRGHDSYSMEAVTMSYSCSRLNDLFNRTDTSRLFQVSDVRRSVHLQEEDTIIDMSEPGLVPRRVL